jgi:hypothetical protein
MNQVNQQLQHDVTAGQNTHTFSVSEVFRDGRVLIVTYVRIEDAISVVMDVYDDGTLRRGKRVLDLHLPNGGDIPVLNEADET